MLVQCCCTQWLPTAGVAKVVFLAPARQQPQWKCYVIRNSRCSNDAGGAHGAFSKWSSGSGGCAWGVSASLSLSCMPQGPNCRPFHTSWPHLEDVHWWAGPNQRQADWGCASHVRSGSGSRNRCRQAWRGTAEREMAGADRRLVANIIIIPLLWYHSTYSQSARPGLSFSAIWPPSGSTHNFHYMHGL